MPVPLDKMKEVLPDGNKTQASLHPSRIEKMVFVQYVTPPESMDDRAEYDAWMERVAYLCDDLHWLLQQPHDKFWCQAVFDDSLHKALDSFLRYCPRSRDMLMNLPEAAKQRQAELCRLVFMVYLRMSTHKESKDHFITPEVFGEILYENFLFDIPKVLDLCSLYGKTNGSLLNKMVGNIFMQQPKYLNDLRDTVPTILQVFTNIAARCGVQLESSLMAPQKLEDSVASGNNLSSMSSSDLEDIVHYLSDTADTLHRFLDVHPPACQIFQQFLFCPVIANFYEAVTPELTLAIKQHDFPSASVRKKLTLRLHQIKKCLLSVVHSILNAVCLRPILENSSDDSLVTSCIEDFLHTMTALLVERRFLAAYEGMFSFQDDVDMLIQTSTHIDSSQFEYIQSAINSAFATFGHRKSPRGDTNTGGRTSPDGAPDSSTTHAGAVARGKARPATVSSLTAEPWAGARPKDLRDGASLPEEFESEGYGEGAVSSPRPNEVEVESLVSSVKDLFPHLGEGFIELALEELDWRLERVVSSVLEEKLPSSLLDISPDLPRQEREVNQGDGQTDSADILDSRKNVFDNDEFDVFRNKKVDMSKIHIGKKQDVVDIEDKSTILAVKATYDAYGSMDQESMYDRQPMYDDEYDDTYDSHAVGADDADSADELNSNRVLPRVLQDLERQKTKGEGRSKARDDDGDDEEEGSQGARDEFVADPAKLREQAEQRRQSQAARGRRGRGGGGG
ncbi:activating signal cointegrator 1 complex subunit 2, partial [Aplysia californica]|uniref:Activating signal cointegrator 1 complex subunit 2 n=1 Tax=Aplysia californica TaxID=6500 RepID=A0ABM1A656_APLCA